MTGNPVYSGPGEDGNEGECAQRLIWLAAVLSAVGLWAQDCCSLWLVSSRTTQPHIVAALQVLVTLAMCVALLIGGAACDLVGRLRLLRFAQIVLLVLATAFAVLAFAGVLDIPLVMGMSFVSSVGGGLTLAAWQAGGPQAVGGRSAGPMIAAVQQHGGRSLGPLAGSLLAAALGLAAGYMLSAVSFLIVVMALRGRRQVLTAPPTLGRLVRGVVVGVLYVIQSPGMRSLLVRVAVLGFGSSALWSLLVLYVRMDLDHGIWVFGLAQALIGIGGLGAVALLRVRLLRRRSAALTTALTVLIGLCLVLLGLFETLVPVLVCLLACGCAWFFVVVAYGMAAQSWLPEPVRGRGLAIELLVLYASMAAGGIVWGAVGTALDVGWALLIAGCVTMVTAVLTLALPVRLVLPAPAAARTLRTEQASASAE